METVSYADGLRRRWWVIVGAVLVALAVGWITRSVSLGASGPSRFEATCVILGSSDPEQTNLSTLSILTTVGPVPRRVATTIGYGGNPQDLAENISTEPDQVSGIMSIDAVASTPAAAERLADAFANELVKYSLQGRTKRSLAETQWLRREMTRLSTQIRQLDSKIASATANEVSLLTAQRDATVTAYGSVVTRYEQVSAGAFEPSALQVVQHATQAKPVAAQGVLGPVSLPWRLAIAVIVGLLVGVVLALALERFDRSIRTRQAAERSFRLPVLAEIPAGRQAPLVDRNGRSSTSTSAPLRLLGAILDEGMSRPANGAARGNGHQRGRTILVTSPTSAESKASIVARLARADAEGGRVVLVLACDPDGPALHREFGVANDRGLSDALAATDEPSLRDYVIATRIPNVWVVPIGTAPIPGGATSARRMQAMLEQARASADIVLIDGSPLLTNGDAPYLLREVDSVLVVARAGKTTIDDASRAADVLERLDAPVAGIALSGARS